MKIGVYLSKEPKGQWTNLPSIKTTSKKKKSPVTPVDTVFSILILLIKDSNDKGYRYIC